MADIENLAHETLRSFALVNDGELAKFSRVALPVLAAEVIHLATADSYLTAMTRERDALFDRVADLEARCAVMAEALELAEKPYKTGLMFAPLADIERVMDITEDAIQADHPASTGRHKTYELAVELVGNRVAKFDLVALVNHLLCEIGRADAKAADLDARCAVMAEALNVASATIQLMSAQLNIDPPASAMTSITNALAAYKGEQP